MNRIYTYYYFIGIGGIGMSAIARYFNAMGKEVAGYDRTPSPLIDRLMDEGIPIFFEDEAESLPPHFAADPEQLLVVYTPAVPEDSLLLQLARNSGSDCLKRSQVLGMITGHGFNLSVAGTHGKTTTSCMLAAIFKQSSMSFTAFLGGISTDLGSNFYHQVGEGQAYTITEADEFDRSFLWLNPSMAAITSTDADHLDIYGQGEQVREAFSEFATRVEDPEHLFVAREKTQLDLGLTYGVQDPEADFNATILEEGARGSQFALYKGNELILDQLYIRLPGRHNLENAVAATLLAYHAGVHETHIRKGLAEFKGIKRRFEFVLEQADRAYIDDYAHHPSELEAILGSVRRLYPERRIIAAFQPHLFSRTKDFAEGFARALEQADELVLLPIYPAREKPMEGISSATIIEHMDHPSVRLLDKTEFLQSVRLDPDTVLLTLGAGDIDRLVPEIKKKFNG